MQEVSSYIPSEGITPKQCATRVMEVIPLVMRCVRTEMRSQKSSFLSIPQFRALAFLHSSPGVSLSDLAEHLGVTRATASATIERLVQRQLVDRAERPEERRQIALTLTGAGYAQLQAAREFTRDKIASMLAGLSEEQLLSMEKGLAQLGDVFKDNSTEKN